MALEPGRPESLDRLETSSERSRQSFRTRGLAPGLRPSGIGGNLLVPTKQAAARAMRESTAETVQNGPPFKLDTPYFVGMVSQSGPDPRAFPMALSFMPRSGRVSLGHLDGGAFASRWKFVPAPSQPPTKSPGPPTSTPRPSVSGLHGVQASPYGTVPNSEIQLRRDSVFGGTSNAQTMNRWADAAANPSEQQSMRMSLSVDELADCYYILNTDVDNAGYLCNDMTLSDDQRDAERFYLIEQPSTWRAPHVIGSEVLVQVWTVGSPMCLCADEANGYAHLVPGQDVQHMDTAGNRRLTDLWELTLDEELPESLISLVTSKLAEPHSSR